MINIKKLAQINQTKIQELKRKRANTDSDGDNKQIELTNTIIKKAQELDAIELKVSERYNELEQQKEYMCQYQDYIDEEFFEMYCGDYNHTKNKLIKHKWLNMDELEIADATSEGLDMMITDLYYINGEIDTIIEYGEPVQEEIEAMLLDGFEPGE